MSRKLTDRAKFELTQFGLVFALFFVLVHLFKRGGVSVYLYLSLVFLIATLFFYRFLSPLNVLWRKFGDFMGRIVGTVILSFIFYFFLTPLALLKRLFGSRVIEMDFAEDRKSFWADREVKKVSGKDFENQF